MKTLYKIILVVLLALPLGGRAQCDLPPEYSGNTGSNMTVMITSAALNSLPLTDENAYLVAHTPGGMLIGSSKIYGLSQASIALWGNDSFTTSIDGAIEGENISLQLVDGTNLYDLDLEINFIINSILPLVSPISYDLVCNNEPVACEMPQPFTGNTGTNMTVMLLPGFISSLNVTNFDAYLVAIDPNGMVVGSEPVASVSQTAIAVWGDDTSTADQDGAAANAEISFQLVDGDNLYDIEVPNSVKFIANSITIQNSSGTSTFNCPNVGNKVMGCTNEDSFNYNESANTDDGSCIPVVLGCLDANYMEFDADANTDDGTCLTEILVGCVDDTYLEYNPDANTANSDLCVELILEGCTNFDAQNYNHLANTDDGSCQFLSSCEIPDPFVGNTGSNMTVMMIEPFINSLNVTDRNAYLVAIDPNGLVVGSEPVASVTQTAMAVWGDDSSTSEVDGAAANAAISFQLVDGDQLYDVVMPSPVSYTSNSTIPQLTEATVTLSCSPPVLGCTDDTAVNYNSEATDDDGSCYAYCTDQWRPKFTGNTGVNMTLMLTGDFMTSLNVQTDDAYLIAVTSDGMLVGSSCVVDICRDQQNNSSLAIWADDTFTAELDGATDGETITVNLIDGSEVYDLDYSIAFSPMGILIVNTAASPQLICKAEEPLGCTDSNACNYNSEANTYDGSCTYAETFYDCSGTCLSDADNDGVCDALEVAGCNNPLACNYNEEATDDDGSCLVPQGCDSCLESAIVDNDADDDGVCDADEVQGCQDETACNFNENATDSGNCIFSTDLDACASCSGEMDGTGVVVDNDADDDGVCDADEILGCDDPVAFNFNPIATDNDGSCYPIITGCIDDVDAFNYAPATGDVQIDVNTDDGSCYPVIFGCMDSTAKNYNDIDSDGLSDELTGDVLVDVNTDDGSCIAYVYGCTVSTACNFDINANTDDGSCEFPEAYYDCNEQCLNDTDSDGVCNELEVVGCQQSNANNYDPLATDSGPCVYFGCMEAEADNYNPNANTSDGSCYYLGCMDQEALNFDPDATRHDPSACINNVADFGCELPARYSGLITGSNMNLLFTSDFTSSIVTEHQDAFVVGITDSDRIVGSAPIQQGQVASITLWGDDVQTDAIDGAVSWELIRLYVVDGNNLYRLSLNDQLNYTENKTEILYSYTELSTLCMNGFYTELPIYGCTDPLATNYITPTGDPSVDVNTEDGTCLYDGSHNCDFPAVYPGTITGNNMNILFTETFMSSLPSLQTGAYIVAANQNNTSFGSLALFDTSVNSLTIWGDDTGTQEVDGATEGEPYHLYLVNGKNLYDISPYQPNSYQNNGMLVYKDAASVKSLCSNGKVVYLEACTDSTAINYVSAATTDDGSCIYEGCTYDVFYEYNEDITVDNGSCENLIVFGCTDSLYVEYNNLATEDNGSCVYTSGRIDSLEETEIAYEQLVDECSQMSRRLEPIPVDLYKGWNIIGYNLNFPQNSAACFDNISENIILAKNNNGMLYWPEYGWNGIGDLEPGQGYQVYMTGEVDDFSFIDLAGMRVEMQPQVPQWAKEMAPIHPNDVRTLVRVVNMLGQEVSVETQDKNTPLLYLYNDGSVEKILTK